MIRWKWCTVAVDGLAKINETHNQVHMTRPPRLLATYRRLPPVDVARRDYERFVYGTGAGNMRVQTWARDVWETEQRHQADAFETARNIRR